MLHRLDLYLFRTLLTAFLLAAAAVTFVMLFTQSFRLLSFVIDNSGTTVVFVQMMGLMLPALLPLIVPIGLGVGTLFVYHKFAVDSELVVMRAAGISPWRLARPVVVLAMLAVIIGYGLTLWITPTANRELVDVQYKVRDDYSVLLVKSGTFNDLAEGLTFFVRDKGKNGELQDILIHDVRKPESPVTIMAESGQIVATSGAPQIVVYKGKRQEVNRETGHLSQLDFDRYVLDLQISRTGESDRLSTPREMSLGELLHPQQDQTKRRTSLDVMAAELHQRLTTPLLALGYALIGVTAILFGAFNRRGMASRIVVAIVGIVAIQAVDLSLTSIIGKQPWLVPLLYALVIAPTPVCLAILTAPMWRGILRRNGMATPMELMPT